MSKRTVLVITMLVLLFLLCVPCFSADKPPAAKPFTLAMKANKVAGSSNQVECYVTVTEVATNQVVCAPKIVTTTDEARITTKDPKGREYVVSFVVQPDGTKGIYQFSARQGDKILQEDKGTVPIK